MSSRLERFKNEMAAGGSVAENEPDDRPDTVTMVLGIGAWIALFVVLAFVSWWIVAFVVGVLVSVFLHEVGHFVTARRSGMKVTQFFMGFGPRIFSFHRDGVEYGLRAIPLGAFVRIIGMNNLDEVPTADEPYTYRQASFPKRLLGRSCTSSSPWSSSPVCMPSPVASRRPAGSPSSPCRIPHLRSQRG